jgi:NAD(P)-dependent dehydrogenase (short-subunit alcohol dehydrogenase family)
MIAATVEAFGRVDILMNVAGTPASRSPEFLSLEEYETQTDVNLRGVLLCMKHAIPAMVKTGGGAIVNVSTVGSLGVQERAPAMYMSAKSAVNSLTKSVAVEFGPSGIRANAIAPGFTLTEVNRGIPADILHELSLKAPLGRGGEAREQAEVAAFLASDRASFLTGVIIPVDGGWSARLA